MVRQQFEDWLADLADDNDNSRAARLTELFDRSDFNRQKDLADAVDVELRTVQRWLAGGAIKKQYWEALADALDTTVRYLIFGEADKEPIEPSQFDQITEKLDHLIAVTAEISRRLSALELEREIAAAAGRKSTQTGSTATRRVRRRAEG